MLFGLFLTTEAKQVFAELKAIEKQSGGNYNVARGLVIVLPDIKEFVKNFDRALSDEVLNNGKTPTQLALTLVVNTCHTKLRTGDFHTISGRLSFGGIALRSLWKFCMDCLCGLGFYTDEDIICAVEEFNDEITSTGILVAGNRRSARGLFRE